MLLAAATLAPSKGAPLSTAQGMSTSVVMTFDKNAVRAFIEKNVPADDFDFTRTLNTHVSLAEYRAKEMGSTQLAAHCFQVKRNADALGLLAK